MAFSSINLFANTTNAKEFGRDELVLEVQPIHRKSSDDINGDSAEELL